MTEYCTGRSGHNVYTDKGRRVKCEKCEALFIEVPYQVGPGGLPLHRAIEHEGEGPAISEEQAFEDSQRNLAEEHAIAEQDQARVEALQVAEDDADEGRRQDALDRELARCDDEAGADPWTVESRYPARFYGGTTCGACDRPIALESGIFCAEHAAERKAQR